MDHGEHCLPRGKPSARGRSLCASARRQHERPVALESYARWSQGTGEGWHLVGGGLKESVFMEPPAQGYCQILSWEHS